MKSPSEDGIAYLTRLLRYGDNPQFKQMINDRDAVYLEYGRMFALEHLHLMSEDDFKGFLLYENNRHWWGIHRHQAKLVADMDRLRHSLGVVLDESRPIVDRLDWIEPVRGPKPLPGIGPAVLTPIMHVVYPDRYAVWNSIAESAMTRLGLWPAFDRGSSFGDKYVAMNTAVHHVAEMIGSDLWTIDSLWWMTELEHEPTKHQFEGGSSTGSVGLSSRTGYHGETFVCASCYQTKMVNLRKGGSGLCVDCASS